MSIINALLEARRSKPGFFAMIGGTRLSGKSTLAGTLPGNTLMIQASLRETGSNSAVQLANKLGNKVDVINFDSYGQLSEILSDDELSNYDNIYIDSITALTNLIYDSKEFSAASKSNKWGGFDLMGKCSEQAILQAKQLSEYHAKNIFVTVAFEEQFDALGNLVSYEPVCKGNKTLSHIKALCPSILICTVTADKDGKPVRQLITSSATGRPGRIDTLLDDNNPGIVAADLSAVLTLINRGE